MFISIQWQFNFYRGTSGIDIDLQKVDIDQCPSPVHSNNPNVFAGSAKCKPETTKVRIYPRHLLLIVLISMATSLNLVETYAFWKIK